VSTGQTLLARCRELGAELTPTPQGTLKVRARSPLPAALKNELRQHKAEVLALLTRSTTDAESEPSSSLDNQGFDWASGTQKGTRDFLPRPLGQENNPDVWEVWTPLMHWLFENHVTEYDEICDSEDALTKLEQRGIVSGPQYEAACQKLLTKFEAGRKLKLHHASKIWLQ
jgi:hypothetical protein